MSVDRKKIFLFVIIVVLVAAAFVGYCKLKKKHPPSDHMLDDKLVLKNRNNIEVIHAENPEKGLVIYLADKHGKVNEYAHKFADLSYYVAVIDSASLIKANQSPCQNLAQQLLDMAAELQQHYDLDTDNLPILVGNDQGASLVYTALAQAEKNSFHAGVSINFSNQINEPASFCAVNNFSSTQNGNTTRLHAAKHLPTGWYIFQDINTAEDIKNFAAKVNNARLTIPEGKEQTPLSEAIQILQWLDPRLSDQISSDTGDGDLPLIEVPVPEGVSSDGNLMAVLLTGDGGWAEIDKNIARILSEKGIPTVALDSLSYFWRARTPEETTNDLETAISTYQEKWQKDRVILIGYSFGADVLPFIANKLSSDTQKNIAVVALLGLGKTASFEFRLSSWMDADKNESRQPTEPELKKMDWINSLCIYGVDDPETNCPNLKDEHVKAISMSGDHHFDKKYEELVQHILDNATPAKK